MHSRILACEFLSQSGEFVVLAGLARRESFTIGDISCRALVSIQLPPTETPQCSLLCHATKGDKPLPRRITWSFVIVDHAFQVGCGVLAPLDDVGELYTGGVAEGNICVAVL